MPSPIALQNEVVSISGGENEIEATKKKGSHAAGRSSELQ